MGFLSNLIFEKRSADIAVASLRNPPDWLRTIIGGQITNSGTMVSSEGSLGIAAVYACVRLIAWTLASLPLVTFRDMAPGKERARDNPVYALLHDKPNPEQTSFQWRSITSVHQSLWGAGISEIEFNAKGQPIALWPLPPWRVSPKRTASKQLVYEVDIEGQTKILWPNQVLVFPALSTGADGWMSPIRIHRETVGYAMALREFGAKTFGTGTNPSGILSGLSFSKEDTEESIKKKFSDSYAGLGGAHRLMLLEEGTTFTRVGLPPEDAQYLQSNSFAIREIARIFNVPLHLIQETDKSTSWGSGIEEMTSGFVVYTMRPYFVQWEQEFKSKLLFTDKKGDYSTEFIVEGLLRGKLVDRYQAYAIARQWGWMCADDICELENRNPLPDKQGKTYLVPMNMIDAKDAGKKPEPVKVDNPIVDPAASQMPMKTDPVMKQKEGE
jgi:HK97 family phage portal protein